MDETPIPVFETSPCDAMILGEQGGRVAGGSGCDPCCDRDPFVLGVLGGAYARAWNLGAKTARDGLYREGSLDRASMAAPRSQERLGRLPLGGASRASPKRRRYPTIGLNLNEAWGLPIEYEITERTFDSFRTGAHGSLVRASKFAWRLGRSVLRFGASLLEPALPTNRIPRTSPGSCPHRAVAARQVLPVGAPREHPDAGDDRNCPGTYLEAELDILKPGVLLGLGAATRGELVGLGAKLENHGDGLWVGALNAPHMAASVFTAPTSCCIRSTLGELPYQAARALGRRELNWPL